MHKLKPTATKKEIIKAVNEPIAIMDIRPVDRIGFELEPSQWIDDDWGEKVEEEV